MGGFSLILLAAKHRIITSLLFFWRDENVMNNYGKYDMDLSKDQKNKNITV